MLLTRLPGASREPARVAERGQCATLLASPSLRPEAKEECHHCGQDDPPVRHNQVQQETHTTSSMNEQSLVDYRISLYLDEPIWIGESTDLNDGRNGTNVTEERSMDLRDRFPVLNMRQHDPGAYDMRDGGIEPRQRIGDDLQASLRLRCGIPSPDRVAIRPYRGRACDSYDLTGTHASRGPDTRLIRTAGRKVPPHAVASSPRP